MKKIVGFSLFIILVLYLILLSNYLLIEEIIGIYLIPILLVIIVATILYLIIRIFRTISYKSFITNSLLAACSLQIVIVSLILWSATPRYFSREQVTNDIDYAVKLMEDVHPNLYAIINKDAFYSKTDSIKKSLSEKISEAEAYRIISKEFSQIHDAHTGIILMNFFIKRGSGPFRKILPYKFKIEDERIFVIKNYFYRNTIPAGSEIIKINGKPAVQCLQEVSQLINFENIPYRNAQIQNPLLWGFWNDFKVFEITYKTSDNKTIRTIKSSGGIISKIIFSKENKTSGKAYSYKTIAGNIGYIEFNSFRDLDKFKNFLDFTFKSIKSNNVKELIIDIRRNEGGNNSLGDELMQYISKSDFRQFDAVLTKISNEYLLEGKLNWVDSTKRVVGTMYSQIDSSKTKLRDNPLRFVGHIYLLIGGNTFSSASAFASSFQCYKTGKIIGTESGGLTTAYFANKYTFKLPNTKLDMGVSDKVFFNSCGIDDRRGVIPDYTVENSIEDEQNGIDRVLEFTIDLIKQNKK